MKIYDEIIKKLNKSIECSYTQTLHIHMNSWPDNDSDSIVFMPDMAYELGAASMPSISVQMMTTDCSLVKENEILLIGKDIGQIKEDTPYARIIQLLVDEDEILLDDTIYDSIKCIQHSKYHVHLYGFMIRISVNSYREQVRVSKEAVQKGLNFSKIGAAYIKQYGAHKAVKAVRVIFITSLDYDYMELEKIAKQSETITEALDHALKEFRLNRLDSNFKVFTELL